MNVSVTVRRGWPWAAAGLSGVLAALAYPPFGWDWLIWVSLAPLIGAIWFGPVWIKQDWVRAGLLGWVAGAVGFLISIFWIVEVTWGGWFALSLYCGIFPGIFGVFLGTAGRPETTPGAKRVVWLSSRANMWYAAVAAAAWVGTEWLRGVLFSGFGWNALGVALWQNVAMLQISDITGVGGLSFVIVMVNVMLVQTVERLRREIGTGAMRPHYDFAFTLALAALVFTYGIRQLLAPAPESVRLRVAAVQANVPQSQKWDPAFERQILERYRQHSEAAVAMNPDLLAWPEASTPRAIFSDRSNWDVVSSVAGLWDGDLLLGTVHFDEHGDFNSIALLTDRAHKAQIHHKLHLVPFGEFIPFRNSFPIFAWIVGDLVPSDFDAGREFTVLEMAGQPLKIGPLVCFEDTIGNLARQFVLRGAQFFVTVTNDGWFNQSAGSMQHLAQSVFRCAENKIPMLRAANTGVTAWIDRHGRVVEMLADSDGNTFIEGVFFGEFPVAAQVEVGFYTKHGEIFSKACLIFVAAFALVGRIRSNLKRK